MFTNAKEKAFANPADIFKVPDWGKASPTDTNFDLGPSGPVAADNLISPNGYCPPAAAPAQAAAPQPPPRRRRPRPLRCPTGWSPPAAPL